MARPLRLEAPGEFFHVRSRGNDRRPIYPDDPDRASFLEILAETCESLAVACHAYCLMGNHYHLLLQPRLPNLSSAMHRLNGSYARRLNDRHSRTGHLFEGRFKSLLIDRDAYLAAVSRYIVLNPVRAKIVDHPAGWPWSSYRATAGLGPAPGFLTTDVILGSTTPSDRAAARDAYVAYVLAGMSAASDDRTTRQAVETGGILGSATFRSRFEGNLEGLKASRGVPRTHRFMARPPLAVLLEDPQYGARPTDRWVSAFTKHGYRLQEIADAAGIGVSSIRRILRSREAEGRDTADGPSV